MFKPYSLYYRIVPIDIDFAGWTEVEAGEHNQWGIISIDGETLHGYASTYVGAETIANRHVEEKL